MPQIPPALYVPLGAVTAAIIAGLFSYLALIIAKEQKISDFRQAWIDGLRNELADFSASVRLIQFTLSVEGDKTGKQEAVAGAVEKSVVSASRIFLRLHPHGPQNTRSAELITAIEATQTELSNSRWAGAGDSLSEVRAKGQALLKHEWERVKLGEKTYVWSKRLLGSSLLIGMFVLIAIALKTAFGRPIIVEGGASPVAPIVAPVKSSPTPTPAPAPTPTVPNPAKPTPTPTRSQR